MMSEFNSMPDMDEPKPVNDFESDWAGDMLEDRVYLYNQYGNLVFESLEQFCDRMYEKFGKDWIVKLKRK